MSVSLIDGHIDDDVMTDNEIIKALECCSYPIQVCNECPIPNDIRDNCKCMETLCENALNLINRQKAEIERYERESNSKFDKWKLLDDMTKQRYAELYEEAKDIVRAKAIKEFAERLKLKVDIDLCEAIECSDYLYNLPKLIDNLVKEMVGAESG